MTKSRIITQITLSGTWTYVGYNAENHLERLGLEVTPLIPEFINEVNRKIYENTKPKQEEE